VRPRTWALASGVVLGLGVGQLVARRLRRRHERNLHHPRAHVRHAALDWFARHPSRAAVRQLQAWLDWEPIPALQRRGTLVLGRLTTAMGHGDAA
jgi:hypothetical protein